MRNAAHMAVNLNDHVVSANVASLLVKLFGNPICCHFLQRCGCHTFVHIQHAWVQYVPLGVRTVLLADAVVAGISDASYSAGA